MLDLTSISLSLDRSDSYGSLLESELCAMKDYVVSNLGSFCGNAINYAGEAVGVGMMVCLVVYAAKKMYGKRE